MPQLTPHRMLHYYFIKLLYGQLCMDFDELMTGLHLLVSRVHDISCMWCLMYHCVTALGESLVEIKVTCVVNAAHELGHNKAPAMRGESGGYCRQQECGGKNQLAHSFNTRSLPSRVTTTWMAHYWSPCPRRLCLAGVALSIHPLPLNRNGQVFPCGIS